MNELYKLIIVNMNTKTTNNTLSLIKAWKMLRNECAKHGIDTSNRVAIDCVTYEEAVYINDTIKNLGGLTRIEQSEAHTHIDIQDLLENLDRLETPQPRLLPRCPMCTSTNIKKIGTTKRMVHGAAFGLFSKTARSQWECHNCGNKW